MNTTKVIDRENDIEIITTHDESGSGVVGIVPKENIAQLINELWTYTPFKPNLYELSLTDRTLHEDSVRAIIVLRDMLPVFQSPIGQKRAGEILHKLRERLG